MVHVLTHEVTHRLDDRVRQPQPLQHAGHELGSDLLMAVKVRAVFRSRLPDVVKQRG